MSAAGKRDDAWRREAVLGIYAERPLHTPPAETRIWSYCDRLSYAPDGLKGYSARLITRIQSHPALKKALTWQFNRFGI